MSLRVWVVAMGIGLACMLYVAFVAFVAAIVSRS